MHRVASNKIDASYTVCARPLVALCQHSSIPSCPLDRNFPKGVSFPNIFRRIAKKNCVSIFFTRLLHPARSSPGRQWIVMSLGHPVSEECVLCSCVRVMVARTPFGRSRGFRMAPRGHVQTLTPRTWERRRASCRCVRRGKCRSMKMHVLETGRTSSRHVNITTYIQPRGASRSNGTFQRLCGLKKMVRLNQKS